MRSAAQVHVQQSKLDTGPDKASHTESPRVEVARGESAGSGSSSRSNTIFDIFMSIQRIYQVGRLRRLEFVLFVSSFCCCCCCYCCCCCFCGRHEMEFRAHKVRRRPRRPNPLMPRGACFAPAHRQHNEERERTGTPAKGNGLQLQPWYSGGGDGDGVVCLPRGHISCEYYLYSFHSRSTQMKRKYLSRVFDTL